MRGTERAPVRRIVRVLALALTLNVLAWVAAASQTDAVGSWRLVSLTGCVLLGFLIGQWWALLVVVAYAVIHAVPVYLGLLPGYLSTWGEALWWAFALALMLALAALGVLGRKVVRRLRRRLQVPPL